MGTGTVHQYGERAVLIDVEDSTAFQAAATFRRAWANDVVEVVPAQDCVLVSFDRPITAEVIAGQLPDLAPTDLEEKPELVTIHFRYDGEDLESVAHSAGMTVDEVITAHTSTTFQVAFCGFSPGFAYLSGLPAPLHLPRRSSPRTLVPAGSVAVAAGYTAVYPRPSPGGWHLLGTTDAPMFDSMREPPALLVPGTHVRFVAQELS